MEQFSKDYTAAWCSGDAARVATFFAIGGSLTINDGSPAIGRTAIAEAVQEFITAFPDLVVRMDRLVSRETHSTYHWTLVGTNTGPSGTGRTIRICGYEEWRMAADGLIAESMGHFDEGEYRRQLDGTSPS
jgi:uncharacterized protein (TIGR02246 family)